LIAPPRPHDTMGDPARRADRSTRPPPWPAATTPASRPGADHALTITQPS
jgi:hypothetical protein